LGRYDISSSEGEYQAGFAGDNQHMERLIKDVMDAQQ